MISLYVFICFTCSFIIFISYNFAAVNTAEQSLYLNLVQRRGPPVCAISDVTVGHPEYAVYSKQFSGLII